MIKKTADILKKNPNAYIYPLLFLLGAFILWNAILPGAQSALGGLGVVIPLLFGLVYYVGLTLFGSGMGNMFSRITESGEAGSTDFKDGVKKFFGRTLLLTFLYSLIFSAAATLVSLIIYGFAYIITPHQGVNYWRVLYNFSYAVCVFLLPFIFGGYPSVFMDNTGIGDAIGRGLRLGSKKYPVLLLLSFCLFIPSLTLEGIKNTYYRYGAGNVPGLYAILSYIALVAAVLFVFVNVFDIYNKEKAALTDPVPKKLLKTCPACSGQNPAEAIFCYRCGFNFNSAPETAPQPARQFSTPQTVPQPQGQHNTPQPQPQQVNQFSALQPQPARPSNIPQPAVQPAPQVQLKTEQTMKKCPSCGQVNSSQAIFCRYCAAKLDAPVNTTPAPGSGQPAPASGPEKASAEPVKSAEAGPNTKTCPACGGINSAKALFCRYCAAKFEQEEAASTISENQA